MPTVLPAPWRNVPGRFRRLAVYSLAAITVSVFAAVVWEPPLRLADKADLIVKECKTVRDVQKCIGREPGCYGGTYLLSRDIAHIDLNSHYPGRLQIWSAEDCCIVLESCGPDDDSIFRVWVIYADRRSGEETFHRYSRFERGTVEDHWRQDCYGAQR